MYQQEITELKDVERKLKEVLMVRQSQYSQLTEEQKLQAQQQKEKAQEVNKAVQKLAQNPKYNFLAEKLNNSLLINDVNGLITQTETTEEEYNIIKKENILIYKQLQEDIRTL
jgi:hypothetical protein